MFYVLLAVLLFCVYSLLVTNEKLAKFLLVVSIVILCCLLLSFGLISEVKECESTLPRNERCVLIAVPEYTLQGEK